MKTMKFFGVIILTILGMIQLQAQELKYQMKGQLKNADPKEYIKIKRWNGEKYATTDSVLMKNGTFELKGALCHPEIAYVDGGDLKDLPIFLDQSSFTISGDMNKPETVVISGGKDQEIYNRYKKELDTYEKQLEKLYEQYQEAKQKGDQAISDTLLGQIDDVNNKELEFMKAFVYKEINSPVSPYVLSRKLVFMISDEELSAIVARYFETMSYESLVLRLNDRVNILQKVSIGSIAPDIVLKNPDGKELKLSDYRGKYVLIDFWASWCGPCRRENPHMVEVYQKYQGKNLEFFAVSLDMDKNKWVKAIKDDGLTWPQVSELKGWNGEVSKIYGVNALPSDLLIDPSGKIIAKKIFGEELDKKLAELLK